MKTEFIPFNISLMSKAVSYKTLEGFEVTQVTKLEPTVDTAEIVGVLNNETKFWTPEGVPCKGNHNSVLLMEVEKDLDYPLLCWVSSTCKYPDSTCGYDLIANRQGSPTHPYKGAKGKWSYATPFNEIELAKFGLKKITEQELKELKTKNKFELITDYNY